MNKNMEAGTHVRKVEWFYLDGLHRDERCTDTVRTIHCPQLILGRAEELSSN